MLPLPVPQITADAQRHVQEIGIDPTLIRDARPLIFSGFAEQIRHEFAEAVTPNAMALFNFPNVGGENFGWVSSSTNDTAQGSHCREIRLLYLDDYGDMRTYLGQTNGTAGVAAPTDLFLQRSLGMQMVPAGNATRYCAGRNDLRAAASGLVIDVIAPGTVSSAYCRYTVPRAFVAIIEGWQMGSEHDSNITFGLYASYDFHNAERLEHAKRYYTHQVAKRSETVKFTRPLVFGQGTDIGVLAKSSGLQVADSASFATCTVFGTLVELDREAFPERLVLTSR